jgi:hypothetical protein
MEKRLFRVLDQEERGWLETVLQKLATDQGLQPGVHPSFSMIIGGDKHESISESCAETMAADGGVRRRMSAARRR